jgi:phage tail protein X
MTISPTSDAWSGTPKQWIEHDPRLQSVVDAMHEANISLQEMMTILPAAAKLLAPAAATTSTTKSKFDKLSDLPASASAAPKPTSTFSLLSPSKAAPPKRKPFEKALATVCGGPAGLGKPWSLPTEDKPAQATPSPKAKRWDSAVRRAVSGNPHYSMPDERAA